MNGGRKSFAALVLILMCVFISDAAAQTPTDKERARNIRRLLQLTKAGEAGAQVIEQMLAGMGPFFSQLPPSIRARVVREFEVQMRAEFTPEKMVEATIPIYARYLNDAEVKTLIEFYETPVGQKLIAVQPQILKDALESGTARGQAVGERVMAKLRADGVFEPPPPQPRARRP